MAVQASIDAKRDNETNWKVRLQEWWFRNRALIGFAFIFPWFAGFIIFDALPFIYNLYLSFTDYQIGTVGTPPWIGLDNYTKIFTAKTNYSARACTTRCITWASACPLRLIFAFLIALILNLARARDGALSYALLCAVGSAFGGGDGDLRRFPQHALWFSQSISWS